MQKIIDQWITGLVGHCVLWVRKCEMEPVFMFSTLFKYFCMNVCEPLALGSMYHQNEFLEILYSFMHG